MPDDGNVYKANMLCELTDQEKNAGTIPVQKIEIPVPEEGKEKHVIKCESCGNDVVLEAVSRDIIQERRKGSAILTGLLILYILLIFLTDAFGSDDMTEIILYIIAMMGIIVSAGIIIQVFGPGSKPGLRIYPDQKKDKKKTRRGKIGHRFVSSRELKKIRAGQ